MAGLKLSSLGSLVVMRSLREPDEAWVVEAMAQIEVVRAVNRSKPIHLVILIGGDLPVPGANGRKALGSFITQVHAVAHCSNVVFEGDNIKAMMQRTLLSGLALLTRTPEPFFRVPKTIEVALTRLADEIQQPPENLLSWFRTTGLAS